LIMELRKKLQVPSGVLVRVVNAPKGLALDLQSKGRSPEAILFFAQDSETLKEEGGAAFEAARADRLAWIAYPKAGQLGTDLSRYKLWTLLKPMGIRPVRQISIDSTWSALRFRPEGHES